MTGQSFGNEPSLAERVREHARQQPDGLAYIEPDRQLTWSQYDAASDRLALRLAEHSLAAGECVGVYLPDGIGLHVALMAAEKAGLIALGIGSRAGLREVRHLLSVARASALISLPWHRGENMPAAFADLRRDVGALREHVVIDAGPDDTPVTDSAALAILDERHIAADEIFLLNSTSGTTGMPKCVVHDQARWYAFHAEARAAADLRSTDVFMSVAPPPFGFGLWTSHVTPTVLGVPTVKLPAFDAERTLCLIQQHGVTVLAAVSSQFVMMLNSERFHDTDFSSLRAMFTGGEMVPYQRALAFEQRTGAAVLQFYGSNETGAFSRTTLDDPPELRLTTAGRLIECMDVRLFNDAGEDVTADGAGQPGGRGPLLSRGYYNDDEANARLYNKAGYMLMEDIVSIDARGYLRVAGRKGDFVIRGGKNISCAAVEQAAGEHPAIALAVAVGVPDAVLGERVMLFVTTHEGAGLSLDELKTWLDGRQVSRELFPEYLQRLDEIPRSSGGKIARGALRALGKEQAEARNRAEPSKRSSQNE